MLQDGFTTDPFASNADPFAGDAFASNDNTAKQNEDVSASLLLAIPTIVFDWQVSLLYVCMYDIIFVYIYFIYLCLLLFYYWIFDIVLIL